MKRKLENKTVVITGGLSGIGKACAMAAAHEGANIVLIDIYSEGEVNIMNQLRTINPNAIFLGCDVSSYDRVLNTMDKITDHFGGIDIALNNAGIGGEANKVGDMTEEAWLKVIGVNLNGVFNCMKHELKQMVKQQQGVIVNMSSILGKVGFASSAHYVAAKHGVIGLTQSAAIEYASMGIRINAICPGFINTPLLTKGGINDNADIKQAIMDMHPMKRFGEAEEIAKGFIFLASADSSFMTGTCLEIDGGYLAV